MLLVHQFDAPLPPFENCSSIYRFPHDDRYANCTLSGSQSACEMLSLMHLSSDYRHYFLVYLPTAISLIALILNASFAIAITIALRSRSIASKHAHIFLFNRSICNIVALLVYYVVLVVWQANNLDFSYPSTAIFIFTASLSFLSLTGIYLAITTLLYIAISRPFWYNATVSNRKCIYTIVIIWLVSIIIASLMAIYGSTLFYPESSPIRCPFASCQRPLAIILVVIIALCYMTVIVFYLIILTRIKLARSMHRYKSDDKSRLLSSAFSKLGLNMLTFAASSLPILVVSIIAVVDLDEFRILGEGDKSKCKNIQQAAVMFRLDLLASCGAIVWLVGMIIDPLINSFGDIEFRSFILICCCCKRTRSTQHRVRSKVVSSVNDNTVSSRIDSCELRQ